MAKKGDQILGRFTITDEISADGIASSYLADDSEGGRVAVQEIRIEALDSWDTVNEIEKRAELYRELSSPSLPRLVGCFSDDSTEIPAIYCVSEHVGGDSLESIVESNGALSDEDTKSMLKDLLEGLISLHRLTPPVAHGGIRPATIVKGDGGRFRFSGLPLPQLASIRSKGSGGSGREASGDAYVPAEQRSPGAATASDIYSLGMSAVYSIAGKHPDTLPHARQKPVYRVQSRPGALDQIIDSMIDPAAAGGTPGAHEILSRLLELDRVPPGTKQVETGAGRDSAVEIVSSAARDSVRVYNPAASRAENLLIGFFLDLWATKPWLIILIAAALSAGPIAIPVIIFLLHPKSKIALNRAYAKCRDVFLTLGRQSLSVSDQVKLVEYSDIADYEIHEIANASGIQLETILKMRNGKEIRFYMNSLSRAEADKIRRLIDARIA